MCKLNVQAIFDGIDGEANGFEGAGQLTTFIRLKGCNLACKYCDTTYTQSSTPKNWMTIPEIIEQIHFPKITITGGEPLLQQEEVGELCKLIWQHNRSSKISIETNGSIQPKLCWPNTIRYIMDYKLASSGVEDAMESAAHCVLGPEDVIKFVISDIEDYKHALRLLEVHSYWVAKIVFSPAIEFRRMRPATPLVPKMDWPRELAERMIKDKVAASYSLQLHKVLWPGATEER